jgi:hypothetical protein
MNSAMLVSWTVSREGAGPKRSPKPRKSLSLLPLQRLEPGMSVQTLPENSHE